jgi:hypothetical protein
VSPATSRGGVVIRKGRVEASGPRRRPPEREFAGDSRAGHPIAPTEFPKARSAAEPIGPRGPPRTATCAPREEDTVGRSRPETATGLGLPPGVLRLMMAHRPAIHRLQLRPLAVRQRGFGCTIGRYPTAQESRHHGRTRARAAMLQARPAAGGSARVGQLNPQQRVGVATCAKLDLRRPNSRTPLRR